MIVTIEGNIGAGKSTLLRILGEAFASPSAATNGRPVVILTENVDEWMNLGASEDGGRCGLFSLFYAQPEKYAFAFQSYVLMSRIKHLASARSAHPDAIIVCERGCMVDYEVFAKSLNDAGIMSDVELSVYEAWHKLVMEVFQIACCGEVHGQIYLRAEPETCLSRIARRARPGEEGLTRGKIEELHARHDQWLMAEETEKEAIHVIKADVDIVSDAEAGRRTVDDIAAFLRRLLHASPKHDGQDADEGQGAKGKEDHSKPGLL